MKKTILSILITSSLIHSAFALTLTPIGGTKIVGSNISITSIPGVDNFTNWYSWWTIGNVMVPGSETLYNLSATVPVPSTTGQYRLRITSSPTGGTFPPFPLLVSNVFTIINPVYGCTNPNAENYNPSADTDDGSCIVLTGIEKMVKNASSTFSATTGFSPGQSIKSVGDIFIKPIIGGGLIILYEIRYWIIVLVVLSAFVYFIYKSYRVFQYQKFRFERINERRRQKNDFIKESRNKGWTEEEIREGIKMANAEARNP